MAHKLWAMFSRLILTFIGLACASAAALVFLPLAVIFDPLVQQVASQVPADHWLDILWDLFSEDNPEDTFGAIFQLIWTVGMLVCILPVTVTALLGASARVRAFAFYAGATGLLAAAIPWILRSSQIGERAFQASSAEAHLTIILFLTGAFAGTIFWLIAARNDDWRHMGKGWMSDQRS